MNLSSYFKDKTNFYLKKNSIILDLQNKISINDLNLKNVELPVIINFPELLLKNYKRLRKEILDLEKEYNIQDNLKILNCLSLSKFYEFKLKTSNINFDSITNGTSLIKINKYTNISNFNYDFFSDKDILVSEAILYDENYLNSIYSNIKLIVKISSVDTILRLIELDKLNLLPLNINFMLEFNEFKIKTDQGNKNEIFHIEKILEQGFDIVNFINVFSMLKKHQLMKKVKYFMYDVEKFQENIYSFKEHITLFLNFIKCIKNEYKIEINDLYLTNLCNTKQLYNEYLSNILYICTEVFDNKEIMKISIDIDHILLNESSILISKIKKRAFLEENIKIDVNISKEIFDKFFIYSNNQDIELIKTDLKNLKKLFVLKLIDLKTFQKIYFDLRQILFKKVKYIKESNYFFSNCKISDIKNLTECPMISLSCVEDLKYDRFYISNLGSDNEEMKTRQKCFINKHDEEVVFQILPNEVLYIRKSLKSSKVKKYDFLSDKGLQK